MFDLSGKVAVVTGASRGLGRQDPLTLAEAGADVVITDILVEDDPDLSTTAEGANSALAQVAAAQGWVYSNQTAEAIRQMGRRSVAIKMDVTNRDQVRDVFKRVKDELGRSDIFMASVAGTMGGFGQASYSATKAAVIGLAKTCALEGGRFNITANAIVPGIIGTEAFKMGNPQMNERIQARTIFKHPGEPKDISHAITFLCTDEASYITGVALEVAGGIPLFVF